MTKAIIAADKLAQQVSGQVVPSKGYARIVLGERTLAYVNPTHLDFKAYDVAKAPALARARLNHKGNRAHLSITDHLSITETKAATTLLKHVADAAKGAK